MSYFSVLLKEVWQRAESGVVAGCTISAEPASPSILPKHRVLAQSRLILS